MAGFRGVRPPTGPLEGLLDRCLQYYFTAAERWHWPPSVVDGEGALVMKAMVVIAEVADEVKAERQADAQRKAAASANHRHR